MSGRGGYEIDDSLLLRTFCGEPGFLAGKMLNPPLFALVGDAFAAEGFFADAADADLVPPPPLKRETRVISTPC